MTSPFEHNRFVMTKEGVEYFLRSIQHEYLNKDKYYETMKLIKRMRDFLDELAETNNGPA